MSEPTRDVRFELIDRIDDVKEKLTSQEYKDILELIRDMRIPISSYVRTLERSLEKTSIELSTLKNKLNERESRIKELEIHTANVRGLPTRPAPRRPEPGFYQYFTAIPETIHLPSRQMDPGASSLLSRLTSEMML